MTAHPIEAKLSEYLHNKAARAHLPLSGSFELTPLCNLQCKMCYVRMSRAEQEAIAPLRTAEEWCTLAQTAKERGMLYLLLTGGEPFLRPDFRELYERLHAMGLLLSINTNGTMITEETVQWLSEKPPVRLNITLYGASNETYARLCGNPNGFTQTTRAIRLLQEAGIGVKLNGSLTPYNCDDLEEMFAFAEREGLILQATSYMFPPMRRDRAAIGTNDRFTPEDAAYYAAKIEALTRGRERFLGTQPDALHIPSECEETEGEPMRCRAGRSSFWVTWDGRLMPCGMIETEHAPNVFETGFDEAWKQAYESVEAIRLPPECKACEAKGYCLSCAAMVMTESGCYHKRPQYRCLMTQAYPTQHLRVQQELSKP